jgi:hypothetical protein
MTKAERAEAVNKCWEKVYERMGFYVKSGLTEEEAFQRACKESEGVPDEC